MAYLQVIQHSLKLASFSNAVLFKNGPCCLFPAVLLSMLSFYALFKFASVKASQGRHNAPDTLTMVPLLPWLTEGRQLTFLPLDAFISPQKHLSSQSGSILWKSGEYFCKDEERWHHTAWLDSRKAWMLLPGNAWMFSFYHSEIPYNFNMQPFPETHLLALFHNLVN